MIVNRKFTINANLIPSYKVGGNTKIIVKSKVVKASIEARVGNAKKLLTKNLLGRIGDMDNKINSADINKVTAFRSSKRGLGVWLILVMVIAGRELIKDL